MMDYKAIPLKEAEYLYTYRNSQQISGQTGLVGYLRADFGSSDNGFFNTWNEFRADYNTDEFKAEFYADRLFPREEQISPQAARYGELLLRGGQYFRVFQRQGVRREGGYRALRLPDAPESV